MLEHTFIHIQGIGPKKERWLWDRGILCWDDFLSGTERGLLFPQKDYVARCLVEARQQLPDNPAYFTGLLAAGHQWRIFPHYRHKTAYLDIETAAVDGFANSITAISLYDGSDLRWYVNGENLDDFEEDISRYEVIVTYNGKCFDVPVIEQHFRMKMRQAHIDLRYVLRALGYKGGLKSCEKQMGLDRGILDGVDGYFAVLLWHEYQNTGNRKALETLLAYNMEDTVNLEYLLVEAYNRHIRHTPFAGTLQLETPFLPPLPFCPDLEITERLKSRYF